MKTDLCIFKSAGKSESGKTKVWDVLSRDAIDYLGVIKWFGRWRCYAFYPDHDTLYEQKCLRKIADFCETESTKARKVFAQRAAKTRRAHQHFTL